MDKTLWEQFKKTGDPTPIIKKYERFAYGIAKQQQRRFPPSVNAEDVEASALVGLWKAIEKFDPSMGVPFESYARNRIIGNIIDDMREEDHVSRTLRDKHKDINTATAAFTATHNRPPTTEELAAILEISVEETEARLSKMLQVAVVSLERPAGTAGEYLVKDLVPALEEDHRSIDQQYLMQTALAPLTKRERLLFALLYFEGFTLDECAPILHLTHPMTCQMHFRIADKLLDCYSRGYNARNSI